ncbi:hypothetical protein B0H17DRAFT_1143451 [Mycena rosella]|uniref:Uncharacterized protein n=1 Tax=Mycena rosella TaxID=1033263 RepID=A0AAD7CV24_MYCRO|nr:hypothetical protein B0H17DRAFT_1143451 [Mycena rosella]
MHPYAATQTPQQSRHRRSDSENMDPSGSGSLDQHYPHYDPSRSSSFRSSGSSGDAFPYTQTDDPYSTRMPTLASVVNIDKLANDAQLSPAHRNAAHAFHKLDIEDCLTTLFVHTLRNEAKLDKVLAAIGGNETTLSNMKTFLNETWTLTDNQEKLLKGLLRHYLIMPLGSYSTLAGHVQAYILKHLATLHLDLYKTDPTVKETVNVFVGAQAHNIKGTFRKLVFSSVTKKKGLTPFARKILDKYHLPNIPDSPPQDVLATFALMREIAAPLVDTSTSRPRGSDTGFWTGVEEALETLYSKHGQDRKSPGWLAWQTEIIAADNTRYARSNAADHAHSRAEVNQGMGLPSTASDDNESECPATARRADHWIPAGGINAAVIYLAHGNQRLAPGNQRAHQPPGIRLSIVLACTMET